ncbi:MAG: hypothetical protein UV74_C0013G0285 [Candidatus Woesebacteria bacterium GW2011_GWB1_43_14]|uniref:Uncharacterized protein n=1 Tax=Candidatus Woesebacteria bacterium GW2011_GWB1_43_14 TaxID=1618578 RepID=A0A0G1GE72_9BACT|nr:MAG: hypothetical protein UT21_C0002G0007 [Candidatus Woesebacteria bacterium GW2011_GWA1_39_11b]KKS97163.1 MAG: hypothetical protein UV74_C0013G0285 [Candidatus Woesebacteria bacterium GW2011_GWB1_43_14]
MESKQHKQIANKIAKIKGSEYHSDKGIDIRTRTQAIEVEVDSKAFGHAKQQLAGSTRAPYIAVPNELVKDALVSTQNTRFGVMNERAKIYKSGRGR